MSSFQLDIYRSDTSILLHLSRRRKWIIRRLMLGGYIAVGTMGLLMLCVTVANFGIGIFLLALWTLPILLLFSMTPRWEMLRIDQDVVRYDSYTRLGLRFSKQRSRRDDLKVSCLENIGKNRDSFSIRIQNGDLTFSFYVAGNTQAEWIAGQIQQFVNEVPRKESSVDNSSVRKAHWSDADSCPNILENMEWQGQPLRRLPARLETVDAPLKNGPEQGVLRIRCEKCLKLIPEDHIRVESAFCACPECRTVYEIPSLKQWSQSHWTRTRVSQDGDTLRIRQMLFCWSPLKWTALLFSLGVFGSVLGACLFIYANAKATLTPEQLHEYLFQPIGASGVNYLMIFVFITVVLLGYQFLIFALILYRYRLDISPESCCFEEKTIFWRRNTTIPRVDVRKYIATKSGTGGLVFRNGMLLMEEGSHLQGVVNRYLLTVPPKDRKPYEADDFTIENSFLGGDESDCIKIDLLDKASGSLLSFENSWHEIGETLPPDRIMLRSPEAIFGSAARISFEKTESTFRVEVAEEASREAYLTVWAFPLFCSLPLGAICALASVEIIKSIFFQAPLTRFDTVATVFAITIFGSILFLVWTLARDEYRSLKAAWTMTIDGEKLELIRRFRNWDDRQTIDRNEILFAEYSGKKGFVLFSSLPSLLHTGAVSLRLRDGRTFDLPRLPSNFTKTLSQGLANKLNDFLFGR